MIDIHVMFMMLLYVMDYGVLLTLAIMVVSIWVSLEITIFHIFMTVCVDHQSVMLCFYEWFNGITITRYHRCSFEFIDR